MVFEISYFNELPFIIELQNDKYEVATSQGIFDIQINSDSYKLHTARFSDFAGKEVYVGEDDELKRIISNSRLFNYAFDNCKTIVKCRIRREHDITDEEKETITKEQCIEEIKSQLVSSKAYYKDTIDLTNQATKCYDQMKDKDLENIKVAIIKGNIFNSMNRIYGYYEALNKFIMNYAHIREFFWVQKLDENILEGTIMQFFCDGKLYKSITHVGYVPSILPHKRKYPDLLESQLSKLKDRLKNNYNIPIEEQLILIARSLWYRKEYRSAIIESSAALEITVEKKLIEKMNLQGKTQQYIEDELKKSEKNFRQRCDHFLKFNTGKSFVVDNSTLWNLIDLHRKDYRHKIAHSSVNPDKATTEEIINDFEKAIDYIKAL